jgi:hypothetical protein
MVAIGIPVIENAPDQGFSKIVRMTDGRRGDGCVRAGRANG